VSAQEIFMHQLVGNRYVQIVRQSPRLYSFFVVTETKAGEAEDIYISADWPSAEMFAKKRVAESS